MNDEAFLIGGKSDGVTVVPPVFDLTMNYPDGLWEKYEHVDLGKDYPFVLRAATSKLMADEIIALLDKRGLGSPR